MAELAERGVIGFKAFMTDSGLSEFPRADDDTLFDGMCEAARLGLPVAVHAEDHAIIQSAEFKAGGITEYLDSRPVAAEIAAIERACKMARQAGAKLHIVHISSGRGAAAALKGRAHGADVSLETCPHYLHFTQEDIYRHGGTLKCAPPLRPAADRDALRAALKGGAIDIVGSDHSPAPASMKGYADFFRIWGGVAGVQSTLPVLLADLPPERVAQLTAQNPATRFGIARKGKLAAGYDADFILVNRSAKYAVKKEELFQRHGLSPYVGETFTARVETTVLRGRTIFLGGRIVDGPPGRLLMPHRT
jgi:allantoinase